MIPDTPVDLQHPDKSVLLATVVVADKIDIQDEAPPPLELVAGHQRGVRVRYKCIERSKERDQWSIQLRTIVADAPQPPVQAVHGDRLGWPDEVWGNISQRLPLLLPGHYTLQAVVRVVHQTTDWTNGRPRTMQEQERTITVPLTIRAEVAA